MAFSGILTYEDIQAYNIHVLPQFSIPLEVFLTGSSLISWLIYETQAGQDIGRNIAPWQLPRFH